MKTDTPETNSHLGRHSNSPDDTAMWLEIGLPRQLERERDEARCELQRVKTTTHAAPPVALNRLVSLSITGCDTCPFYADKYCSLSQMMNSQHGTDYPTFVANEWKQGGIPSRCPLRKSDMLFSLEDA
jgi:hypothetical protein